MELGELRGRIVFVLVIGLGARIAWSDYEYEHRPALGGTEHKYDVRSLFSDR